MINKPDLIFVLPPYLDVRLPYLGAAYLSEYLEGKGYKTEILDINIDLYNSTEGDLSLFWHPNKQNTFFQEEEFLVFKKAFNSKIDEYAKYIIESGCKVLAFYIFDSNILFAIDLIKRIKFLDKDIKIVFGGPFCFNINSRRSVYSFVDYIIPGEGELSLLKLLEMIKNGKQQNIPGVLACKKDEGEDTFKACYIDDLSQIPFPKFKKFDLAKYQVKNKLPIILSRGCGYGCCSFCDVKLRWPKVRFRKAKDVYEEMVYHARENGVSRFYFNDSCINFDLKLLDNLLDLVIKNGFKVELDALMRVRSDMGLNYFKKMKEAGFWRLEYGLESGSEKIIKLMKKGISLKDAEHIFKTTHDAGIINAINIIVGFPGETEKEFKETLDFITKNKECIDKIEGLTTCHVLPFTDIDANREKYGIMSPKNFWGESWYSFDNNTLDVRLERKHRLIDLLLKLGIKFGQED